MNGQRSQKKIAEFKKQSIQGTDANLKSFAAKTIPTLEHHLMESQNAMKAVQLIIRIFDKNTSAFWSRFIFLCRSLKFIFWKYCHKPSSKST